MNVTHHRFLMEQWTRDQIMKGLQELIPEITFLKKSEEFDGKKGGIWISGEHDWLYNGTPPFDHSVEYGDFPRSWAGDKKHGELSVKTMYVNGIHREIFSWLEERGWYHEWYDKGTLLLWKRETDSNL